MPRWSNDEYQDYIKRCNAQRAVQVSAQGLSAPVAEQPKRKSLVRAVPRKAASGPRFEIVFTIYAVRPTDWDNPHTKIMQDLLVHAGILHDDGWRVLQGRVISAKANNREEERTEITIEPL